MNSFKDDMVVKKLGNFYVSIKGTRYKLKDVLGYNYHSDSIIHFDDTDSFFLQYHKDADEEFRIRVICPDDVRYTAGDDSPMMIVDDFARRFNICYTIDTVSLLNIKLLDESDEYLKKCAEYFDGYSVQTAFCINIRIYVVLRDDLIIHIFGVPAMPKDIEPRNYMEQVYFEEFDRLFGHKTRLCPNGILRLDFSDDCIEFDLHTRYNVHSVSKTEIPKQRDDADDVFGGFLPKPTGGGGKSLF